MNSLEGSDLHFRSSLPSRLDRHPGGADAGIAAPKTPNPTTARLRSLMTHAAFGLYLAALVTAALMEA